MSSGPRGSGLVKALKAKPERTASKNRALARRVRGAEGREELLTVAPRGEEAALQPLLRRLDRRLGLAAEGHRHEQALHLGLGGGTPQAGVDQLR